MNYKKMMQLTVLAGWWLASLTSSWAENAGTCATPGVAIRWEASYCMFLSETDDLESKTVQECLLNFSLPDYDQHVNECNRKIVIQKALCELLVERKLFGGSVEDCRRSSDTIPKFVTQEN